MAVAARGAAECHGCARLVARGRALRARAAGGLGAGTADTSLADETVRGLERAKWRLWHGRWPGCRRKLAALCLWTERKLLRDVAGVGRLQQRASELLGYLERNEDALVHYAARRRRGEPISTAFVESAIESSNRG